MTIKGKIVVATVASLFAAAAPMLASAADAPVKKVKCEGINACSGHGSCKSATNACSGKNGCKGKGWIEVSEKECKDKGGKIVPDAKPSK